MTAELRDVLVLLPMREQLRLAVGVSVERSRAWGRGAVRVSVEGSTAWGQQGPGVSVEGSRAGLYLGTAWV